MPAITKGKVEDANFGSVSIDKQSIGSIIEGFSSKLCNLKTIRVTIGTLKNLDVDSVHALGTFLQNKGIKVNISHIADSHEILKMFKKLDDKNKGYLVKNEFNQAYNILKLQFIDENENENSILPTSSKMNEIFNLLAIRRLQERDRVYFLDFYDSLTNVRQKYFEANISDNNVKFNYDITSIDCPIHYIFDYVVTCADRYYKSNNNKNNIDQYDKTSNVNEILDAIYHFPKTANEWSQVLNNNLLKLFYFIAGLHKESQPSIMNQQNILFTILFTKKKILSILSDCSKRDFDTTGVTEDDSGQVTVTKIDDIIIDGEIPLSKLLVWFIDKLFVRLIALPTIQQTIVKKHKINKSQSQLLLESKNDVGDDSIVTKIMNSLELSLALKNYEYFVVLCLKSCTETNQYISFNEIVEMVNKYVENFDDMVYINHLFVKEGKFSESQVKKLSKFLYNNEMDSKITQLMSEIGPNTKNIIQPVRGLSQLRNDAQIAQKMLVEMIESNFKKQKKPHIVEPFHENCNGIVTKRVVKCINTSDVSLELEHKQESSDLSTDENNTNINLNNMDESNYGTSGEYDVNCIIYDCGIKSEYRMREKEKQLKNVTSQILSKPVDHDIDTKDEEKEKNVNIKSQVKKAIANYNNDYHYLTDISRIKIEYNSMNDLVNAILEMNKSFEIVQIQDFEFSNLIKLGWINYYVTIKLPFDKDSAQDDTTSKYHYCEIQLQYYKIPYPCPSKGMSDSVGVETGSLCQHSFRKF